MICLTGKFRIKIVLMPYTIKLRVLPLLNECERGKTNVFTVQF